MGVNQRKTLGRHRDKQRRRGLVRVEVQVPRDDADRVRALAQLLRGSDASRAQRARNAINTSLQSSSAKELLASMPEDIPLSPTRRGPRDVAL